MDSSDWFKVAALVSPLVAAFLGSALTIHWQGRNAKRADKMRLFTALMASRNSPLVTREWVNALNLIDVVFAEAEKVIGRWKSLYASLHQQTPNLQNIGHLRLELLSEIASELGYKNLTITDIDKFYFPVIHGEEEEAKDRLRRSIPDAVEKFSILLDSMLSSNAANSPTGKPHETHPPAEPKKGTSKTG